MPQWQRPFVQARIDTLWQIDFEAELKDANFVGATLLLPFASKRQREVRYPALTKCVQAAAPLWVLKAALSVFPGDAFGAVTYALMDFPVQSGDDVKYVINVTKVCRNRICDDLEERCVCTAVNGYGPLSNLFTVALLAGGYDFSYEQVVSAAAVRGHVGVIREIIRYHWRDDAAEALLDSIKYSKDFSVFSAIFTALAKHDREEVTSELLDFSLHRILNSTLVDADEKIKILNLLIKKKVVDADTVLSNGRCRRKHIFRTAVFATLNTGHNLAPFLKQFLLAFGFSVELVRILFYLPKNDDLLDLLDFVKTNWPPVATNIFVCQSALEVELPTAFFQRIIDRAVFETDGFTLFCLVCNDRDVEAARKIKVVKKMVDVYGWKPGADVDELDNSCLHYAAKCNSTSLFKKLLEFEAVASGADEKNVSGLTPLEILVRENASPNVSCLKLLLSKGAVVSEALLMHTLSVTKPGNRPDPCVLQLLKHGALLAPDRGKAALRRAVDVGNVPGALALLDFGVPATGDFLWEVMRDERLSAVAFTLLKRINGAGFQKRFLFEAVADSAVRQNMFEALLVLDGPFDLTTTDAEGRTLGFYAFLNYRYDLEGWYHFESLASCPSVEYCVASAVTLIPQTEEEVAANNAMVLRLLDDLSRVARTDLVEACFFCKNALEKLMWEFAVLNPSHSKEIVEAVCRCILKIGVVPLVLPFAARNRRHHYVDALLREGVDVDKCSDDGTSLFLLFAELGDHERMGRCRALGADLTGTNARGENATVLAALGGHREVLFKLIEWGSFSMAPETDLSAFPEEVRGLVQGQLRIKRARL
jgi:hypothetical protein